MTQAERRFDENHSAAQAEIERLKQALSREHDMRLRALADFDNYRKRVQRERRRVPGVGDPLDRRARRDDLRLRRLDHAAQQGVVGLRPGPTGALH